MKDDALQDIVVLDLSQNLPGPYCSFLLKQKGAKVIKIESPKKPDPAKYLPGLYDALNAGKDIITVDITCESGKQELENLVKQADVIIEGARPGVAAKLGIDFDTLKQLSDKLIYCSISGYGQTSEKRLTPAHDINLQAASGICSISGTVKNTVCSIPIADMTSSHLAFSEILAALVNRRLHSAKPVYIDIAMGTALDEMVSVWQQTKVSDTQAESLLDKSFVTRFLKSLNPIRAWLKAVLTQEPLSRLPHYGLFTCKDGVEICIGIVDEKHFWESLCEHLGGLLKHLKSSSIKARLLYSPVFRYLLKRRIKKRSSTYWLSTLNHLPVSQVR